MNTIYEKANGDFSNLAHEAAKRLLYPAIFGVPASKLKFESTLLETSEKNRILDGEMAVDRIVTVEVAGLRAPLSITIQERFRRKKYAEWQDITITEWNCSSGLPSELYKIKSGLFVYGYYDPDNDRFVDAICFPVPDMQLKLIRGDLKYDRFANNKSQFFISLSFKELERCGLIRWRMDKVSTYDNKPTSPWKPAPLPGASQ